MANRLIPITDIVDTISDTHNFSGEELFAVNTSDVLEGKLLSPELLPISKLKGQFKKTFLKNDILFSEIRPANRRYAFIDFDPDNRYVASTKLMVLRKKNDDIDLRYFYYFLTSQHFLNILQNRAENRIGSFPQITYELLGEYSVPCPELAIQQRISEVLKKIDDSIENNDLAIEKIRKTLIKYAEMNHTLGTSKKRLESICIKDRRAITDYNKGLKTVDLATIDSDTLNLKRFSCSSDFGTNLFTINKYDLFYGSIRPYLHKSGISPFDGAVAGTVYSFKVSDDFMPLILGLISTESFHNYALANANGTKMPVADYDSLMNFEFNFSADLIKKYNTHMISLVKQCVFLMEMNQKLMEQRETLRKNLYGREW